MLHDRGAAAGLDRVQTGGAIVEHPREHQPHGARVKGQGHGPEHRVDGRAMFSRGPKPRRIVSPITRRCPSGGAT
jgi:hypothetical protein